MGFYMKTLFFFCAEVRTVFYSREIPVFLFLCSSLAYVTGLKWAGRGFLFVLSQQSKDGPK